MTRTELQELKRIITQAINDAQLVGGNNGGNSNGNNNGDNNSGGNNNNGSNNNSNNRKTRQEEYSEDYRRILVDEIKRLRLQQDNIKGNGLSSRRERRRIEQEIKRDKLNWEKGFDVTTARVETINQITNIVSGVAQGLKAGVDIDIANKKSALQERKNLFDQTQKIFQANMEMTNVVAENVVTTITSFTTKTATEAARSLRQGAKNEAAARIKLYTQTEMAKREFDVAETERKITLEKERAAAEASAVKSIGSITTGVGALFGPMGMMVGAIVGAVTNIGATLIETGVAIDTAYKDFNLAKKKQENEMYQMLMGNVSQIVDKVKKLVDAIDEAADAVNDNIRETDKTYRKLGLTIGYSGDKFASVMRRTAIQTAKTFGITAEQMQSMQENFIASSGRSLMLGGDNYNQMEAISRTFGISQNEVAGLMGNMNIFNVSMDSGYKMFNDMYRTITKMGLSTTKFAKDLTNNLKLAQKYNFKGGLKNMMEMTKWAQQTRFNLNSATSFADKLINGSLSEVLESSAKLQVLGGSAAIYSDPLGMMYDAGVNVGDMAKRMAAMFSDISGTFNKETGETEFSWYENRMIGARAQALGMDVGEVRDMIRQNQKQGIIDKALSRFNLNENTRTAIGNRAEYVNGQWQVNTLNGPMKIEDVANLTDKQRAKILLPDNEKDSLIDIAKNTRSMVELEETTVKYFNAVVGSMLYPIAKEASDKNIETQNKLLKNENYTAELGKSMLATAEMASAEAQATLDFINNNQPLIQDYRKTVMDNIGLLGAIDGSEKDIVKALADGGIDKMGELLAGIAAISNEEDKSKRDELVKNLYKTYEKDSALQRTAHIFNGEEEVYTAGILAETFQPRIPYAPLYNEDKFYWRTWRPRGTKDGFGNTNGGIISGASNVRSINDGRFNVRTASTDQYLAAMPNGPIDKILQVLIPGLYSLLSGNDTTSNDVNVNVNGRIDLSESGSSVNLVDIIKNDPTSLSRFVSMIKRTMEVNQSGKPTKNYYLT